MHLSFAAPIFQAFRAVARRPAFALPAIAGLAVGIAASSAVFSAFAAMEFESMGLRDPARLVAIWLADPAHGQSQVELSYGDWLAWRNRTATGAEVALASSVNLDFSLQFNGVPEHVDGSTVTGNFFRVLGPRPLAGRFLTEEDDQPAAPLRIVISHALFRKRFGGDPGVVGRQVRFAESSATIVGVARPEFDYPRDVAVWVPLRQAWPTVEKSAWIGVFRAVARLAPGYSQVQASARLDGTLRQDNSRPAGSPVLPTALKPIRDEAYGPARPAASMLMAAVLLLLMIACANAANLMLALHSERAGEMAVRAALGAGRRRILGMLVGESAAIACLAGLAGLLLARAVLAAFGGLAPPEMPGIDRITLNWSVALFGLGLTAATLLLFGAAPALLASQTDPGAALQSVGTRAVGGKSQNRLRHLLIAMEVALSTVLVVGAGLVSRSFLNLAALHPGFQPEHVLTFRITTELGDQPSRRALYAQVLERLRALPGVESAAAVLLRPLSGAVGWDTGYEAEGQPAANLRSNPTGNYEAISPGYFRTLRIPLLAGRDFDSGDAAKTTGVVILNQSTARRLWPDGHAIGRRLRLGTGPQAPWLTVVGVAGDVRYREWEATRPDFYVPYTQRAQHRSDFVLRTAGDPWRLASAASQAVFAVDKNQPVSNVTTLDALVGRALARARLAAILLSAAAFCAAGLAAIGIYGLLSYSVGRRAREIGVRTALGASPRQVAGLITAEVMRFVAAGVAAGLIGAAAVAHVVRSQFFGVVAFDTATYAAVAGVFLLLSAAAAAAPAWQASRIDPASALRR